MTLRNCVGFCGEKKRDENKQKKSQSLKQVHRKRFSAFFLLPSHETVTSTVFSPAMNRAADESRQDIQDH